MIKFKFLFFSLLKLPSTIIHELLHATPVLIFTITDTLFNIIKSIFNIPRKAVTQIVSFNLIPDYKSGTLGSVGYINANPIQLIIINLAPLLAWPLVIYLLILLGYINVNIETMNIKVMPYSPSLKDPLLLLGTIQLFYAGILSRTDIKNVITAVFTLEFIINIVIITTIVWLVKSDNFTEDIIKYTKEFSSYFWNKIQ